MTTGALNIPISRRAKWSFAFLFVVTGTNTPLDLTGLGPFVCQVRSLRKDQLLATATVTSAYDNTGIVTITLSAAQTATLPLGKVRMGLRDSQDNAYLEGTPEVVWFTPTPATV